jgi:hypothetical protein
MKAETFTSLSVALLAVIFLSWLIGWAGFIMAFQIDPKPILPCKDFHNCRIVDIRPYGEDSTVYSAVLTDTCRHSKLVYFKAESGRFNAGDEAQGNFFVVD